MMYDNDRSEIFSMEISEHAKGLFLNMARWAKFLAIAGFVVIGIMLVAFPFLIMKGTASLPDNGEGYQSSKTIVSVITALALACLYFYPTYALLMYSIKVRKALLAADQGQFEVSIKYLKNMFKYMGILVICLFILYGIVIIFAFIFAATRGV